LDVIKKTYLFLSILICFASSVCICTTFVHINRCIELNPVRARDMANHPSEYPWSSYRCNALGYKDVNITPHAEYIGLGGCPEERQKAYRALFKSCIAEKTLGEIREATNKSWVLGSSHFKERIEGQLNRRAEPLAQGGDRKSAAYRDEAKIKRI